MKFVIEDWEVKVRNSRFKATHLDCRKEVKVFDSYGHESPFVVDHDEDSYCVCACMFTSPRLKEFKIIAESIIL